MDNHAIPAYFYTAMFIDSRVPIPLVCQFDNRGLREVYPRAGFNLHPSFVVIHSQDFRKSIGRKFSRWRRRWQFEHTISHRRSSSCNRFKL